MKKFSFLLATTLPIFMLGGCASTGGNGDHSPAEVSEAASNGVGGFHRNPADAALNCSDPSLTTDPTPVDPAAHWEDGTFAPTFNVNGGVASKQVIVNQLINLKVPVPCQDVCPQWTSYQQPDPQGLGWDDYANCNVTGGTGKSDAWNKFYNAPMAEKPAALDKAIKGIGPVNAENLVKQQVFNSVKPHSWNQFVSMIQNAQNQKILTPGIANLVTSTYGRENMENLGYDASTCTPVHHPEPPTVYQEVDAPCPYLSNGRYGIQSRNISSAVLPVTINISAPVMQSFERDQVGVKVSYDGQRFTIRDAQASALNQFNFRTDVQNAAPNQPVSVPPGTSNVNVFFTERARVLVDLPSDIIGAASLSSGLKSVIFSIPANLGPYPPSQASDQLIASYSVEQCDLQGHIYTLGYKVCGAYYTTQPMRSVLLKDGNNLIQIIPSDATHKVRVSYQISRRNSRYYNSNAIGETPLVSKAH